jgi:hypothetical protein
MPHSEQHILRARNERTLNKNLRIQEISLQFQTLIESIKKLNSVEDSIRLARSIQAELEVIEAGNLNFIDTLAHRRMLHFCSCLVENSDKLYQQNSLVA